MLTNEALQGDGQKRAAPKSLAGPEAAGGEERRSVKGSLCYSDVGAS